MMFFNDPTFWVMISFIIFCLLIWWKARQIIAVQLDGRVERIKSELEEAQQLKEQAQNALAEQRKRTRQATEEAEAMLVAAKVEAAEQMKMAEKKLLATIDHRQQQALQRLAQAEKIALAEISDKTVKLSIDASRVILAEQMGGESGVSAMDKAIKSVDQLAKSA